jgi:hypothetical protein
MKRSILILLTPLLLAGCIRQSASYYIDGANHSLTVRAEQEYFWSDEVVVKLVAAHMPDCQRLFPMTTMPAAGFEIALYSAGDNVYSVRVGKQVMRVETQNCTRLTEPTNEELGEQLGTFRLDADNKMVFEKTAGAAGPVPAGAAATAN